MISLISIENFRSIEYLELNLSSLTAIIGPNGTGKTNILKAIDIILGETWPSNRAFDKDDFFNKDLSNPISIEIHFSRVLEPVYLTQHGNRPKEACSTKILRLTHTKVEGGSRTQFDAIDENGKEFYANNAVKDQVSFVYIPSIRDLERQLTVSRWTILGKILQEIDIRFRNSGSLEEAFRDSMETPRSILESDFEGGLNYKVFKETFIEICQESTRGLAHSFDLDLEIYDPLFFYKTIQIIGKEGGGNFNAQELGTGVQNLILLSLFQTYAKLMKDKVVLAIEEPENFLYPQAQRHLYSNFRSLSCPTDEENGTQILYTTHSPNFITASKSEEIILLRKENNTTISLEKTGVLADDEREEIKLLTEFTSERNEIFFADKVVLVEGDTERHSFPFLLEKLGFPCETNNISIISADGKDKLRFLIKACQYSNLEWVAFYDTDLDINEKILELELTPNPIPPEVQDKLQKLREEENAITRLNQLLNNLDARRTIPLDPNFITVLGLQPNKRNKWREIQGARDHCKNITIEQIPDPIKTMLGIFYSPETDIETRPDPTDEDDIPF